MYRSDLTAFAGNFRVDLLPVHFPRRLVFTHKRQVVSDISRLFRFRKDKLHSRTDMLRIFKILRMPPVQKNFPLADEPEKAVAAFPQRLTALGYAEYVLEPHELIEIPRKECDIADFEKVSSILKING